MGSYALLFVSLAAHAAQFGFLVFFENPRMFHCSVIRLLTVFESDIERMYGQRKAIAKRTPVQPRRKQSASSTPKLTLALRLKLDLEFSKVLGA